MSGDSNPVYDRLFANTPRTAAARYPEHLIEQYKLYIQSHEKISERRQGANQFFVTLNTAVVGAVAFLLKMEAPKTALILLVSLGALAICVFWFLAIRAYDQLNTGKFKVIHALERRLPLSLYEAEWIALGEGKDPSLYTPISHLERYVPVIFAVMYLALAGYQLVEARRLQLPKLGPVAAAAATAAVSSARPQTVALRPPR